MCVYIYIYKNMCVCIYIYICVLYVYPKIVEVGEEKGQTKDFSSNFCVFVMTYFGKEDTYHKMLYTSLDLRKMLGKSKNYPKWWFDGDESHGIPIHKNHLI